MDTSCPSDCGKSAVFFRTVTQALALLGLVLVIANAVLVWDARHLQQTINDRQVKIGQDQQVATLTQQLVQLVAHDATDKNDTQLKDLLASNNIKLTPDATPKKSLSK